MFSWNNKTATLYVNDWTDDHYTQFEKLFKEIGQVCVFVRCSLDTDDENPYDAERRKAKIIPALGKQDLIEGYNHIIIQTPKHTRVLQCPILI